MVQEAIRRIVMRNIHIKTYRKKPVLIEAIKWNTKNTNDVAIFTEGSFFTIGSQAYVNTLEGRMNVQPGDYIIRGVKGEFYNCKPDIFTQTYEEL